ncbi:excitatory amino acid transporter 1-like [Ixodes scapularis]|uniref:excitatory amino acid transporter 1-like n=1 Tax=Ixodes scapularis TaxID=6945 RepID=UPI001A9F8A0F|nr:excitatory amino acid transporter 1-like [Ixodes scapularis]
MSALRPYIVVLLVAVCVLTFLVLPLLQRLVLCRFRDVALFSFYGRIYNALLMSAATASGAATLPVAVYALEQNSGLDARVARFVAPVGVIINQSGMALYLSVSGTFLAQIYKVSSNTFLVYHHSLFTLYTS